MRIQPINCLALAAALSSCDGGEPRPTDVSDLPDTTKIVATESATAANAEGGTACADRIPTRRFLSLAQHMDSSGFSFDTARFRETYTDSTMTFLYDSMIVVNNFVFYRGPLSGTIPYWYNQKTRIKIEYSPYELPRLDFKLFEKVEGITAFFFVQKQPISINGVKYSADGVIEEWKFPTEQSARDAAVNIGKIETKVYVNRGAYICWVDCFMYIFHTRAVSFYGHQQIFFNQFVQRNNAKIPNGGVLREGY